MNSLEISRRQLIGSAAALALAGEVARAGNDATAETLETKLGWLDIEPPKVFGGTTFGIPWPRGAVRPEQEFRISSPKGAVAIQSWPLAYWPDGSLKWSAHAAPANTPLSQSFSLMPGKPKMPPMPVHVEQSKDRFIITTGAHRWIVPRHGKELISQAFVGDVTILTNFHLVALKRDHADLEDDAPVRQTGFVGEIENASLEQSGPVRVVVRIDGKHDGANRKWLPFTVRLYFYAGAESVRIVHTFIFDGKEDEDFIAGIGVSADVPMRDALYDRHVRFTGENCGVWGEAIRSVTGLRRDPGIDYRTAQIEGRALPPLSGMSQTVRDGLQWVPAWNDFTLAQNTADGYVIRKRMATGQSWIRSDAGQRATGAVYVGGANGGVALAMEDFWQRSPTRLDVRNAASDKASVTAWLWSPDATMDLRPYRPVGGMDSYDKENQGLNITYEDYEPGWNTAYGIARTSTLTLWALAATPSHARLSDLADIVQRPPRLMASPSRLHQAGVFGIWGLPDRTSALKAEIEDHLTYLVNYYLKQIEQRRWYGFWDYGDVMHTYDTDRHVWRYDIGGYAWDNSELSTDMMFWYYFLRTGRADIFRMAEAMTRHTGEVDVYHIGPYRGFGTRHGVQHFSDSSKQPRVSNAAFRRFYYYLTADERCGDLMRDLAHSDETLLHVDIGRKVPAGGAGAWSGHKGDLVDCGFGTVWGSIISAWLTEWERTGNVYWRDRILNGMNSIAKLKYGWFAGDAPLDLKTGAFQGPGDYIHVLHLNGVFGVFEMHGELMTLLNVPDYKKVWLDYCRYYNASNEEITAFLGSNPKGRNLRVAHSRMTAYAAKESGDKTLVKRAWKEFFQGDGMAETIPLKANTRQLSGPEVLHTIDEDPFITTNGAAQWGLAAIANLALIGDAI